MDLEAITWVDVDPTVLTNQPRPSTVFLDLLGLQPTRVSRAGLDAHVDLDERHHQTYGIVHGGVHAAIVETACSIAGAAAVHASGHGVVGVSNTTDFLRPHRLGRLEVTVDPVHVGRTQHLWRASLARGDGQLVAQGQVRLHVVDPEALGG